MGRTKHLIENNQDNEFYLQAEKVFLDEEYYYYQKQKKEKKRAHGLRFIPHRAIEVKDSTDRTELYKWANHSKKEVGGKRNVGSDPKE